MMQSKNRYVIDPSLVSGTAQRYSPYGNFSPSPEKPNQPPMNPVASFPSSNETLVHQKQGVNYSHSMSPQIPSMCDLTMQLMIYSRLSFEEYVYLQIFKQHLRKYLSRCLVEYRKYLCLLVQQIGTIRGQEDSANVRLIE